VDKVQPRDKPQCLGLWDKQASPTDKPEILGQADKPESQAQAHKREV
jgi:hypothetical protein